MECGVALGIDLGTNVSAVATLDDGEAIALLNSLRHRTTPSCATAVSQIPEIWEFGESALQLEVVYPDKTLLGAKQLLGVDCKLTIGFTAERVVAEIFQHLKEISISEVSNAAISVPAYFSKDQRKAFLAAVHQAKLEEVVLVDDVAAALAAYAQKRNCCKTVLLVDAGAGGSSVAVASVSSTKVTIIAMSKEHIPGGNHITDRMVNHMKDIIFRKMRLVVTDIRDTVILRRELEEAKKKLSRIPTTCVKTFLPGVNVEVNENITRLDLETVCEDLIQAIANEVMHTMHEVEVTADNIQNIVLVGGSARIPHLRTLLERITENKVCVSLFDPDEAVAKGLALIGNCKVDITQQIECSWFIGYPIFASHSYYEEQHCPQDKIVRYAGCPIFAAPTYQLIAAPDRGSTNESFNSTSIDVVDVSDKDCGTSTTDAGCVHLPDSVAYNPIPSVTETAPQLDVNNICAGTDEVPFFGQMDTSTPVLHSPASVCDVQPSETKLSYLSNLCSSPMLEADVLIPEVIYGENKEDLLNDPFRAESTSLNLSLTADDTEKSPPADEKYRGRHLPGSASRADRTSTALSQDNADGDTGEEQEARKQQFQVDLNDVLIYLKDGKYPSRMRGKQNLGTKKNFRRQCEPFHYENGKMYYKPVNRKLKKNVIETQVDLIQMREVIMDTSEQERLIKMFHEGTEDSCEATAMGSHKGRDRLVKSLKERFYWQSMYSQSERYCQLCITCKTVNPASLKVSDCMQPVAVPTRHMAQIGIDLSQMPEVDGKKYIIVAIDYFTKWVEAEAIGDKAMGTVARFLYTNVLCRHSCPETIITDQGREFCNALNTELMLLCGGRHRVTSPYHPQANGLVERANRTIKNAMLKVLHLRVDKWPYILPGVLFAQRTSIHASTKFSPFFLLYGRHPRLPGELKDDDHADSDCSDGIDGDVKDWNMVETNNSDTEDSDPFDMKKFAETLRPMDRYREEIDKAVEGNIKKAQDRQRRGYNKRHSGGKILKVGDEVFLINQRRRDRKGGNYERPRSGPYTIVEISDRKNVTLKNLSGTILKTKYPLIDLEPYVVPPEREQKRVARTKHDNSELPDSDVLGGLDTKKPPELVQLQRKHEPSEPSKVIVLEEPTELPSTYDEPVLSAPREITKEELLQILKKPEDTAIVYINRYKITTGELSRIENNGWLNDMIINAYFAVICNEESCKGNVYCLSTYFMPKVKENLTAAHKWTQNVNLFGYRIVLVPVHVGTSHWALCAVDNTSRTITYYDSISSSARDSSDSEMDTLQTFIKAEHSQRVGGILERYKTSYAENPYQENLYDCGVFVCFFGRRLAQGQSCEAPADIISKMRFQMSMELLASKLLPEDFLKDKTMAESLTYSTAAKCGIQNLNNTCFISSTLQLLFHCEPFLKIIRGSQLSNMKRESVISELNAAYDSYMKNNVLVPSKLVEVLSGLLPRYKRGQQYDAEEFLNFLLQRASEEVRECAQTFQSSMNIQLTCLECKAKVDVMEESVMLPLLINKSRSVQDCIRVFFEDELITDYKCNSCKKSVQLLKSTKLTASPDVLIIQLKRFLTDGSKVKSLVRQPLCLKVGEEKYHLLGAVNHKGTAQGGHYVATVKIGTKLVNFDDSKIKASTIKALNKEQSYVLFYVKDQ